MTTTRARFADLADGAVDAAIARNATQTLVIMRPGLPQPRAVLALAELTAK